MKKVIISAVLFTFSMLAVQAGNINYGYNAQGDYVPTSIKGERIQYGYNARGDYVPTSIGNKKIDYGFNAKGDYVPTSIGGNRVQYGYNARGDYVPTSVGNTNINYGYAIGTACLSSGSTQASDRACTHNQKVFAHDIAGFVNAVISNAQRLGKGAYFRLHVLNYAALNFMNYDFFGK